MCLDLCVSGVFLNDNRFHFMKDFMFIDDHIVVLG